MTLVNTDYYYISEKSLKNMIYLHKSILTLCYFQTLYVLNYSSMICLPDNKFKMSVAFFDNSSFFSSHFKMVFLQINAHDTCQSLTCKIHVTII